jgi:hypothetical protein
MAKGFGLFNSQNNAARVMLQMEAERAKRIQDAGAGMDPIVASMARAQQGMRESVGDLTRSGMGLFGKPAAEDPRMTMAKKVDSDRTEILAKIRDYASDGTINENEMREGFALLAKKGYMKEAKEFLTMAQSMRKEKLEKAKVNVDLLKAAQDAGMTAADYNAIRKSAAESLNATFTTDITGKTSITLNGQPLDTPGRNRINAAIEKAVQAWIDAGGGSKGFKAVSETFPKNGGKTVGSKPKTEKKKNPPPPPPGFGP